MATGSSSGSSSGPGTGADTIVARATPPGRGALAVVRLSGPEVAATARRLTPKLDLGRAGWAQLVPVLDEHGRELDRAVAVLYRAPRSFTGEDLLEITLHGSPFLVRALLAACRAVGCRDAGAGEFTRRAVAAGKLDLLQAEGIADLARAETAWQARLAAAQVRGELSQRLDGLRRELVALLALLEAELDFEEAAAPAQELELRLGTCRRMVAELLRGAAAGARVRDGARVVILGPVNAGKSSLFNALAGQERAIVAAAGGTTRDLLEVELEIAGVPVVVVDTAGLGKGEDPVEEEGRRRAAAAAERADVVVMLDPVDGEGAAAPAPAGRPWIGLRSKADLAPQAEVPRGWLAVSVRQGWGLDALRERLGAVLTGELDEAGVAVAISERHRAVLERAAAELAACDVARGEVAAEAVRWALAAVAEVTGAVAPEEVLDAVFARFCLGK